MDKKNISNYQELISLLPQGNITYKKINGKVYPYYQWVENGKQRNRVVKKEELEELIKKIEERKQILKNRFQLILFSFLLMHIYLKTMLHY